MPLLIAFVVPFGLFTLAMLIAGIAYKNWNIAISGGVVFVSIVIGLTYGFMCK